MSDGGRFQSNLAILRASARMRDPPPTSVGQAKKSDSITPWRPVALRNDAPRNRSAGSFSAILRMSTPKDACTTIPMTMLRYVCRTKR